MQDDLSQCIGCRMFKRLLVLFYLFVILRPQLGLALPEIARYGHFTCTTCHVSPGGGGTLTSYGRDFAAFKLSTWKYENEENPAHGLLPLSDTFLLGGDARWVSINRTTGDKTLKKFWRMNTDIEGAVHYGPMWLSAMMGTEPAGPNSKQEYDPKVRGFAARADLWDDHVQLRTGLFIPRYGLMLSDHTTFVRRASGLPPDAEQTQFEASFQSDHFELFAAGLARSTLFDREGKTKSGFNFGASGYYRRIRLNVNALVTQLKLDSGRIDSVALGTSGVVTFTRHVFGMYEFVRVTNTLESEGTKQVTNELANFFSLNIEPFRGVIPYVRYEFRDTNLATKNTSTGRWGGGANWYPRPHFQFEGRFLRSIANATALASNELSFILHYYF